MVNASRCDVWVVCARLPVCALSLVSLVFGEVFFAGSASLHDRFLHFLESAFSATIIKHCYSIIKHGTWNGIIST